MEVAKKIFASFMMPIFIFQMASFNLLLVGPTYAETTTDVATVSDLPLDPSENQVAKASVVEVPDVENPPAENVEPEKVDLPEEENETAPSKEASTPKEEVAPEKEVDSKENVAPKEEVAVEGEKANAEETVADIEGKITPEAASIVAPEVQAPAENNPKEETKKETWSKDGDKAVTNDPVELNKKYVAPQNDQVTVTFTKLPDESGILSIEEVTLTDKQVAQLGAFSNKAYDITSDMENGSFEYDLSLPKPDESDEIQVKYAEEESDFDKAETVSNDDVKIESDKVGVKLDHFTIFVVVDDGDDYYSDDGWSSHNSGYQGDHKYVTPSQTGMVATWTFDGTDGEYAILPSWTIWDDHAENAHYESSDISGFDLTGVNQKQPANDSVTNTANGTWSGWMPNTERYSLSSGDSVSLAVESDTSGNIAADAMAFVGLSEIYVDARWAGKEDGEEVEDEKVFGINAFATIQEGINAVSDGGTVNVVAGTYDLTTQLNIAKNISIIGNGNVVLRAINSFGSSNSSKHLISIYAGTSSDPVTISNITLDSNDYSYGLNTYGNAYGVLDSVTIKNSKGAGLTVNGSTIDATDLNTNGNSWGAVNVDPGSGVTDPSLFMLNGGNLSEDNQIWSDGSHVGGSATVTVDATGFNKYVIGGTTYIKWISRTLVTTEAASSESQTGATLNGTNGDYDASKTGFWYGPSNAGQFVSGTSPFVGTQMPSDWVSTGTLSATGVGLPFNANITGLTPDTMYYFVAWSFIDGVWYPGEVKSFTTEPVSEPTNVRIYKGHATDSNNLIASDGYTNDTEIRIAWDASADPDVDCYWLGTKTDYKHAKVCGKTYYDGNMTPGKNPYFYQVTAIDKFENESSTVVSYKIYLDTKDPTMPDGLSFSNDIGDLSCGTITNNYIVVAKWNASIDDNFSHYEYRSFNPSNGWIWEAGNIGDTLFRNGSFTVGDGEYGFAVRAVDKAGNVSSWTSENIEDSCQITYDSTAPATPTGLKRIAPNENEKVYECGDVSKIQKMWPDWNDNTEEDFSHYEYSSFNPESQGIDEQSFSDSIFKYSGGWLPSEGTYGFAVRAVDKVGNKSDWALSGESLEGSCEITYDSTAPTVAIINPTESLLTGSVEVRGTVTDDHPHHYWLQIKKNGTVISSNTVNESNSFDDRLFATLTDDGDYEITLAARDAVGGTANSGNRSADVVKTFTIDNTPPNIPAPYNPNSDTNPFYTGDAFTQIWSNEIATGSVKYEYLSCYQSTEPSDDECPVGVESWTDTYTGTSKSVGASQPDSHFFWHVRSVDLAGNKSDWSEWREIIIDSTTPTIDSQTTFSGWYNGIQTSIFAYSDANGIASGTPVSCDIATEGTNQTCSVTPNVCDDAGNCNTTPITSNGANIDLTNPESAITFPDNEGDNGTIYINDWNGTISGTASDDLSGVASVELSIQNDEGKYWDGISDWVNGETRVTATGDDTWSYILTPLDQDTYTIKSHAIDEAGNVENTYTLTIVYDQTIPEVNLTIDPNSPNGDNNWYDSKPDITLTASDNTQLDKIEYQIDSETGTWTTYSTPVKIDDGKHIFYYRSWDKAGNESAVGVKNVKVDTQDPDEVRSVDAEYKGDDNKVKLSWDVEDSDIYKVYIYRGGSRNFKADSTSKIAENDDNDETYNDNGFNLGEKYYYKLITRDEAGNTSDTKVISISIPEEEGGTAIVTDEGTELTPQGEAGIETIANVDNEEQGQGEEEPKVQGDQEGGQGDVTVGGAESKCQGWPLWVWILALIGFAVLFISSLFSKFKEQLEDQYPRRFIPTILVVAVVAFWYFFDKCDEYRWFAIIAIIGSIVVYLIYLF
ncbi:MAG: Ig-like domain repeat protein, partial [Patescibacteria group bacterium]|nr:Ig-like domain repeat protein [Patescibacteria group bacterium]